MSNHSDTHLRCIVLLTSSRSLLVTCYSGLSQETSWDVMYVRKSSCHMTGGDPADSRDMFAALGFCLGVLGTAVGPSNTAPPHIYSEGSC